MAKRPLVCPGDWQKLLLCTDGSPDSQGAVAGTLELARACGSKVYVLQVIEIMPEFEAVAPDLRACLEEEVRRQMAALRTEAAAMGVVLECRIRHSTSVFAAIQEEAEQIQPHLIVMGRHGRSGLSRLLMGSVTARVIGYSPVKVLVVPQSASLAFAMLLVASDGSGDSAAAFTEALSICKWAESTLVAVSVAREEGEITMAEDIIRHLVQAANQEGVPLRGLVPQGQAAADAIVQAALRNEVDLIVMGSHGRTGLKRLLMGSVTERVIGQAPCPVLVVRQ